MTTLTESAALDYINATPALQSVLYDFDLMPEQVLSFHYQRKLMLVIATLWKAANEAEPPPSIKKPL